MAIIKDIQSITAIITEVMPVITGTVIMSNGTIVTATITGGRGTINRIATIDRTIPAMDTDCTSLSSILTSVSDSAPEAVISHREKCTPGRPLVGKCFAENRGVDRFGPPLK
ncbi:MAG: hypothetical protein P8X96_06175 [Desulfobacteraceae bacterium]